MPCPCALRDTARAPGLCRRKFAHRRGGICALSVGGCSAAPLLFGGGPRGLVPGGPRDQRTQLELYAVKAPRQIRQRDLAALQLLEPGDCAFTPPSFTIRHNAATSRGFEAAALEGKERAAALSARHVGGRRAWDAALQLLMPSSGGGRRGTRGCRLYEDPLNCIGPMPMALATLGARWKRPWRAQKGSDAHARTHGSRGHSWPRFGFERGR